MARIIFLLLTSALTLKASFGQTVTKFKVGLELGPGIESLRGNDIVEKHEKSKISYGAGFFTEYNFNKTVSFHTGLFFENKGSKIKSLSFSDTLGNFLGGGEGHTNFKYLDIPLLAKVSFGNKIHFFINAGPSIGYLLRQTTVAKADNGQSGSSNYTSSYKRFSFGFSSGFGLTIPANNKFDVSFEIRDNLGLSNISAVDIINNGTIKANGTDFLIGCAYKLQSR